MPRIRMLNTVRTDTLEHKIAYYRATKQYDAAAALEALARSIGAPIRESVIDKRCVNLKETLT